MFKGETEFFFLKKKQQKKPQVKLSQPTNLVIITIKLEKPHKKKT